MLLNCRVTEEEPCTMLDDTLGSNCAKRKACGVQLDNRVWNINLKNSPLCRVFSHPSRVVVSAYTNPFYDTPQERSIASSHLCHGQA